MQYTKAKENGRVAVGYAQAQAGAQAPAHAQHTNTRTYNVHIYLRTHYAGEYRKEEKLASVTTSQLVRFFMHKHALGYKLEYVLRTPTGTWAIALAKVTLKSRMYAMGSSGPRVGSSYDHECPYRDALVSTGEGRE